MNSPRGIGQILKTIQKARAVFLPVVREVRKG